MTPSVISFAYFTYFTYQYFSKTDITGTSVDIFKHRILCDATKKIKR